VLNIPRRSILALDHLARNLAAPDHRGGRPATHLLSPSWVIWHRRFVFRGPPPSMVGSFLLSPQDRWGRERNAKDTKEKWGRCSGAEAAWRLLGARWPYRQNRHQGRSLASGSDRAANSTCSSAICLSLLVSCSRSISITVPLSSAPPWASSISTTHRNPCGVGAWRPVSTPLSNRRRTVGMLMCRWPAASLIVISMVNRLPVWVINWVGGGYPNLYRFPMCGGG